MLDLTKIEITPEMMLLIAEIDEFKGQWRHLENLTPERLISLRKVATIESIGSSTRIEGAKLSDSEVEKLLSNLETYSFVSRDEQEVAGYAYVCQEIFERFDVMTWSEGVIKQLHGWLLKFSNKDERHRGEYKKLSNNVEAFDEKGGSLGIVFETASPFETPEKMRDLIFWVKDQMESKILHPLLIVGVFVVIFLAIHPFQDGNGRLSRLLTTLLLLKFGYFYVPYSSLESVIERSKESYYLALRRTQGSLKLESPDLIYWLTFFLRALQKQKSHLETKIDMQKKLYMHMSAISSEILILLKNYGRLGLRDFEEKTQTNIHTLKKHLAQLTKDGHILCLGKGRATWYALP
jgi:Fic family protein